MLFPQPLKRGLLLRRYKRFLADVLFDDGGEVTVHTPNPGAMLGLNAPGSVVWCSTSPSAARKLPLTWELVEADGGLVGVNTHMANTLVAEALAKGSIAELKSYERVRREVRYGAASRIDFLLHSAPDARTLPPLWLEVKSVTLSRSRRLAEFPDCKSERAPRHLRELQTRVVEGDRACVMFVVQRSDCEAFSACRDLDPAFADALESALDGGVEILVYGCELAVDRLALRSPLALATPSRRTEAKTPS